MPTTSPLVLEERTKIAEAVEAIREKTALIPRVGVICGTGMGALADRVKGATRIPYDQITHFPLSTVESHHGNLLLGNLGGQPVCLMQGRFHFYEGYTMKQVTFPVRVMKALGCEMLIVMNAVGSMNQDIPRGSLVFIEDFINMMGVNPLVGPNDDTLGPRFPDMFEPYNHALIEMGEEVALKAGIRTHRGILVGVTGPNLETRAEYRAFRAMG
ncbi:TPA: purine-nucleoside phosphorylase, partial [Candidatus Sumerlaeota bacterium]|nr:purine-nucleoside phosphorylase [Candidatus Sumerlaeota bacterium]